MTRDAAQKRFIKLARCDIAALLGVRERKGVVAPASGKANFADRNSCPHEPGLHPRPAGIPCLHLLPGALHRRSRLGRFFSGQGRLTFNRLPVPIHRRFPRRKGRIPSPPVHSFLPRPPARPLRRTAAALRGLLAFPSRAAAALSLAGFFFMVRRIRRAASCLCRTVRHGGRGLQAFALERTGRCRDGACDRPACRRAGTKCA